MADKVFEDRLSIYVRGTEELRRRLPAMRALGIIDFFLPRAATKADLEAVRQLGGAAHMWWATDGLSAKDYAERTLADIAQKSPGAGGLNIELGDDPPLRQYVEDVVRLIRAKRRSYRLAIDLAPFKGFAIPQKRVVEDPNLYVRAQNYGGNMDFFFSPSDVKDDLEAWGAPKAKVTVLYAAACRVHGSATRQRVLPELRHPMRGCIYNDDLMSEVGLLP